MSYSFIEPCFPCVKKARCTDRVVLSGAISGIIHQMPYTVGKEQEFGHLGAGCVVMTCGNLEVAPKEVSDAKAP
jgi:hypothetical protein